MEALALQTGAPTVRWEYNTSCISVVESKWLLLGSLKNVHIPVCFLQQQIYNGIFLPKYEKYSVMLVDMCTKPCSGPIISQSTKYMTGLRLYLTSDTEYHQLVRLHEFVVD